MAEKPKLLPCDDGDVMRIWRECGLPEYFLGNGGTNHKLVAFAEACARRSPLPEGRGAAQVPPPIASTAEAPAASGWRTIDSAPKDGTPILVFLPSKVLYPSGKRHADGSPFYKRKDARCMIARWTECPPDLGHKLPGLRAKGVAALKGGYWTARADGLRPLDRLPTHWQPLPPPPSQEGASEGERQVQSDARAHRLIHKLCNAAPDSPGCKWPECDCG